MKLILHQDLLRSHGACSLFQFLCLYWLMTETCSCCPKCLSHLFQVLERKHLEVRVCCCSVSAGCWRSASLSFILMWSQTPPSATSSERRSTPRPSITSGINFFCLQTGIKQVLNFHLIHLHTRTVEPRSNRLCFCFTTLLMCYNICTMLKSANKQ